MSLRIPIQFYVDLPPRLDLPTKEIGKWPLHFARESWIIAIIGLADLLTTIVFIRQQGASEANPLFHLYWEMGLAAFIAAKAICTLGPLLVLEWARKRNPRFVQQALRGAICGYLLLYGIGFSRLNTPKSAASELAALANADSLHMYAECARRSEERMLLAALKLPRVPRPVPVATTTGAIAYVLPENLETPTRSQLIGVSTVKIK